MKIWVDDVRTPPDDAWTWVKTSHDAIRYLTNSKIVNWRPGWGTIDVMSLDHDLGGDDTTRPVVLWMCENDFWPVEVRVHSQNPVGRDWLLSMISRYHPTGATNPARYEKSCVKHPHWSGMQYDCLFCRND